MNALSAALSVVTTSILSLAVRLISLAILARLLAPEQFGVVAMALTIQALVSLVAQLDMRDALIQSETVSRAQLRLAWRAMGAMALTSYLLTAALAGRIEAWTGVAGLAPVLLVTGLNLFLDLFLVPVEAMLIRAGRVSVVGTSNIIGYMIGFTGFGVTATLLRPGAFSLAFAYVALAAVKLFYSAFRLARLPADARRGAPVPAGSRAGMLRHLLRFALFGTANRFFTTSTKQVDNLVVGSVLGGHALGFYSRAYALSATPMDTLLGLTIRSVIFPSLARMRDDPARFRQAVRNANAAGTLLSFPIGLVFCVLAPELIRVFLGPGWEESIIPFQCLSLALGLGFGPRLASAVGRALGRQKLLFWMNLVMTMALVLLVWLGARWSGIVGASIGVLAATLLQWLAALGLMAWMSGGQVLALILAMARPALLSLGMAAGLFLAASALRVDPGLPLVTLICGALVAGAIGLGTMLAFPGRVLGAWERDMVAQILARLLPGSGLRRRILGRLRMDGP
ncbi:oligosaccharide flippase family protein [Frigidibacter sp. ROC022]|uniref:oligosaccharide flippase family protein n=1 Tax=Frigidibacter sp. ROC022 TaxID=2971796 RepID=UPI00215AA85D|nr:oligosaccharide flippase family protein [Frigidibacter sp. ROC022]MCR8724588.1 oligosaccharide flippase family protein [Frigidibacter sp. ROC022]